jgi:hypothetical protein
MMVTGIALAGVQLDLMVPLVTIYSTTMLFFLLIWLDDISHESDLHVKTVEKEKIEKESAPQALFDEQEKMISQF